MKTWVWAGSNVHSVFGSFVVVIVELDNGRYFNINADGTYFLDREFPAHELYRIVW